MKRKVLILVAFVVIIIAGIATYKSAYAQINPDCPNGCVAGQGGCHCFVDYPFREATWPEDH